ncbi:hypothetical protein [Cellulomonas sp. C5510]|uniref:hypothetical protein n=1 Tax=Cellulomonas sp. C5510 TaxID=2871170 RepID=UPI001C97B651|nr:hypothetical protein [Cellulomonas sp. C5510]QZN86933.1 hypothetical protein K5O09_07430 [Cellulomonas sp. C5510]
MTFSDLTPEQRLAAAREHVAHAVAQAGLDATVTTTQVPAIRVEVTDLIRRHSLAGVVTDGRPITREVIYTTGQPTEILTGWSRIDPAVQVSLVGPTPRSIA